MSEDAPGEIDQQEFEWFRDLLREQTGLLIDKPKLRRRLRGILDQEMAARAVDSLEGLLETYWEGGTYRETMQEFVNECLVNETLFYRYPDQMNVLTREVFPRIVRNHDGDGPIRVLSAGCSTGAEPYSVVMAYREFCRREGRSPDDPGLSVVGVDASTSALHRAREGVYPRRPVLHAPSELVDRYFEELDSGEFCVANDLHEDVSFQFLNVLNTTPPVRNDLVLCRNVMLYFDESTRERLIRRLHDSTKKKGFLLVSPSEDLRTYREYVVKTPWSSQQVYRCWFTDRRRTTVGSRPDRKQSPMRNRRDPLRSKPPCTISARSPNESKQLLTLEGVLAKNVDPHQFLARFERCHRPGAEQYVLDLREADYISNFYLRVLRRPLRDMLDSGSVVRVIADREEYRDWVERCYRDPNVEVYSSEVEGEPVSRERTSTDRNVIERRVFQESAGDGNDSSEDPIEGDGQTEPREVPEETSAVSARKTERDNLIEFDESTGRIRLEGRFEAGDDPELRNDFESELFSVITTSWDRDSREYEELTLDLRNVQFFDRTLVPVLNRFSRRAQRASFSLELDADDDLRSTLERWGCEIT